VVDLTDVTSIDERGEELLQTTRKARAESVACGVYVKHVVELINGECDANANREGRSA
jgi:hypothetical protein